MTPTEGSSGYVRSLARRELLLAAGAATLGALVVTGARAIPNASDSTAPSEAVSHKLPAAILTFAEGVSSVPANGLPHRVADIDIFDIDLDYDLSYAAPVLVNGGGSSLVTVARGRLLPRTASCRQARRVTSQATSRERRWANCT